MMLDSNARACGPKDFDLRAANPNFVVTCTKNSGSGEGTRARHLRAHGKECSCGLRDLTTRCTKHTAVEHCAILDDQSRHSITVQTTLNFFVVLEPERLTCGGDDPIYIPASAS